jgi:hypothetical protein
VIQIMEARFALLAPSPFTLMPDCAGSIGIGEEVRAQCTRPTVRDPMSHLGTGKAPTPARVIPTPLGTVRRSCIFKELER